MLHQPRSQPHSLLDRQVRSSRCAAEAAASPRASGGPGMDVDWQDNGLTDEDEDDSAGAADEASGI